MTISSQTANYTSYKYIVTGSEPGPFHTIQSCIDYVQALGISTTVFVRPGTYTEDLTLYDGINVTGSSEGQVIVVGTHTPPATGTVVLTNLYLSSLTSVMSSVAAGTTDLTCDSCTFDVNQYVYDLANWTGSLHLNNCLEQSVANALILNNGGSAIEILNSSVGATGFGSTTLSGLTRIFGSSIYNALSLSGASAIDNSYIEGSIAITGTNDATLSNSKINSGANTALIATTTGLVSVENCVINATGLLAIDGSSSVELTSCSFTDVDDIAGTIVLPLNSEFRASKGKFQSLLELTDGGLSVNGTGYGDDGQILIGNTATNKAVWASISSSDGSISFTAGPGTLDMRASGGADWHEVTTDTAMEATNGYSVKSALGVPAVMTLPVTAAFGTIIEITGNSTDLYTIAQNANQQIQWDGLATTLGAGGSLQSTQPYQSIKLLCVEADLIWNVLSATGNFTIV